MIFYYYNFELSVQDSLCLSPTRNTLLHLVNWMFLNIFVSLFSRVITRNLQCFDIVKCLLFDFDIKVLFFLLQLTECWLLYIMCFMFLTLLKRNPWQHFWYTDFPFILLACSYFVSMLFPRKHDVFYHCKLYILHLELPITNKAWYILQNDCSKYFVLLQQFCTMYWVIPLQSKCNWILVNEVY